MKTWSKDFNIVSSKYHNKHLEGNECYKFLSKLDTLDNLVPETLKPYLVSLKSFREVIRYCFKKDLQENYKSSI